MAGIEALDAQRATLREADLRSLMFDRGEELFCETVDLFLARNRVDRAFQYMEHGRARALLERIAPEATPVEPIAAAAVQRMLEGDEMLVEFAILRQDLAAIIVSAEGIRVRRWRVDPGWLRRRIVAMHQLAANGGAVTEFDAAAEDLYDAIVRPLSLPDGARVTFVLDRMLETVPYAALRDRVRGRRLAELNIIALAPSATIWSRDPATAGPRTSVLVVASSGTAGGRLPVLTGVEDEAMRIASLYRTTRVLRGDRVTKSAVIAAMTEAEVVHFGGHAVADPAAPGRSFLALADRNGRPELLSAAEISQIQLPHTQLIVLAACDTIRGDPTHVEGMPSLARAFLAAGADNVVASLWSVDDERAAPFVESFHAALATGVDPASALRDAQRKSIRDRAPPAVWSSFLIAGSHIRKMPRTVPLTR